MSIESRIARLEAATGEPGRTVEALLARAARVPPERQAEWLRSLTDAELMAIACYPDPPRDLTDDELRAIAGA